MHAKILECYCKTTTLHNVQNKYNEEVLCDQLEMAMKNDFVDKA